ncbi:hypothetical protein K493DRAFT_314950 [Basidiobolus meristosporus CBS 931.73]|uniref:F-box domain-containing protein n=1 Tax=Basidiobolus meristosporus CBS 931.73 TaxID=1314790 RepID=A0A1Y1YBY9_9FUNG|nr:hypothetical protein K493DRAFT_314950 [Basidiobolus meristosporus CBS 931.73]|eukprot:ORX95517.1 hypothetical protein K493DRAFT_314950 [Basidiobolus meristosporus CBS 931.73]
MLLATRISPLHSLPNELALLVYSFLDPRSIIHLSLCSRKLYSLGNLLISRRIDPGTRRQHHRPRQTFIRMYLQKCRLCWAEDGYQHPVISSLCICTSCHQLPSYVTVSRTTAKQQYGLTDNDLRSLRAPYTGDGACTFYLRRDCERMAQELYGSLMSIPRGYERGRLTCSRNAAYQSARVNFTTKFLRAWRKRRQHSPETEMYLRGFLQENVYFYGHPSKIRRGGKSMHALMEMATQYVERELWIHSWVDYAERWYLGKLGDLLRRGPCKAKPEEISFAISRLRHQGNGGERKNPSDLVFWYCSKRETVNATYPLKVAVTNAERIIHKSRDAKNASAVSRIRRRSSCYTASMDGQLWEVQCR